MKSREVYLDYIRCFAFFSIIVFHFGYALVDWGLTEGLLVPIEYANVNLAEIGVQVFVLISGFCQVRYSKKNQTTVDFYKRKLDRIFPYFYFSYLIALLHTLIRGGFNPKPQSWTLIFTILGIDGYVKNIFGIHDFYLVGEWFLGAILICYLLFPLLYKILKNNKRMFYALLLFLLMLGILTTSFTYPQNREIWFIVVEFSIGMIIGNIKRIDGKVFVISLLVLCVLVVIRVPFIPRELFITIVGLDVFFVIGYIGQLLSRLTILSRIIVYLSEISFPTYLIHHIVSNAIVRRSGLFGELTFPKQAIMLIIILVIDIVLGSIVTCSVKKATEFIKKGNTERG